MDSPHKSSNNSNTARIQTRSSSRLKRKPFSDLTNTTPNPSSRPEPEPKPKPLRDSLPVLEPPPAIPSTAGGDEIDGGTSTPKSKETFIDFCDDADNNDKFDISTIYSRQAKTQRKCKGKAAEAASALSCPPLGRITSIGSMRLKAHVEDLHEALSVPSDKTRKRTCWRSIPTKLQKPMLPPDFVEKQKAYFADIDAFELPEEEVSDDALE